jgi:hypothetical protein
VIDVADTVPRLRRTGAEKGDAAEIVEKEAEITDMWRRWRKGAIFWKADF